jgi:hypothetical protein
MEVNCSRLLQFVLSVDHCHCRLVSVVGFSSAICKMVLSQVLKDISLLSLMVPWFESLGWSVLAVNDKTTGLGGGGIGGFLVQLVDMNGIATIAPPLKQQNL